MARPETIWYCPECGRVAQSSAELLGLGCEGIHQRYVRDDLAQRLIRAIREHERAVEAKVSKGAWSVANAALYRTGLDVEQLIEEHAARLLNEERLLESVEHLDSDERGDSVERSDEAE